jgi:hypothetical protein
MRFRSQPAASNHLNSLLARVVAKQTFGASGATTGSFGKTEKKLPFGTIRNRHLFLAETVRVSVLRGGIIRLPIVGCF